MSSKMSLHLALVAAVAMVGCAGAGETPVQPENEAAAVTRAPDATTEIAAPESTKIQTPISSEEVSRLTSEPNAGKSEPNTILTCPACHYFEPDLTVVEDDRPQTVCTPQYGCYPAYAKGFVIKNSGNWGAPTFHVAVLMGSDSYGFDVPGLGAGQSIYFQMTRPSPKYGPACGETALVLVNPFNAVVESNYSNNAVSIQGYCFL
jgi:hypothetical protein